MSMRAAARHAGVSHNAPYRHFPDRDSLLAELAVRGFSLLKKELEGSRGREMGQAYVRFALAQPELFRLMFGAQLRRERHPALREAARDTFGVLVSAFRSEGAVADPDKAAAAAWCLVHGLAQLTLDGHFERDEQLAGKVLSAVRFAQRSA